MRVRVFLLLILRLYADFLTFELFGFVEDDRLDGLLDLALELLLLRLEKVFLDEEVGTFLRPELDVFLRKGAEVVLNVIIISSD